MRLYSLDCPAAMEDAGSASAAESPEPAPLEQDVEFKEAACPIGWFLGVNHHFDELTENDPAAARSLRVNMTEYTRNAVAKFEAEYTDMLLKSQDNPYVSQFLKDCESYKLIVDAEAEKLVELAQGENIDGTHSLPNQPWQRKPCRT